jgi:ketosteroid isomerase-like protein
MYKIVIFAFFLCANGFSQSKPAAKPAEVPSPALMSNILAAWNTGDPTKAAPFYDKSANNVYFDIAPLKYRGWAEYDTGVRQILSTFQNFTFTLHDDVRIHRSGNTAWGTATWSGQGKLKNGNGVSLEGRWSCIWEKKGAHWLIVHEHHSVPWAPEAESRHR